MTMWADTEIARLFNLQYPIVQAPMAGSTTPELVATVSNSGGLGSLGAGLSSMTPEALQKTIRKIRTLTDKPFAVNLFSPEESSITLVQQQRMCDILKEIAGHLDVTLLPIQDPMISNFEEKLEVILKEEVPIFSFTFGIPEKKSLDALKANGIKIIGTATSLLEAKLLEEANVDAIVAQGIEAGGHRGTFPGHEQTYIGLMALIPQLVDRIKLPVIAAGGIADVRGIKAAFTLGASGVQIGTAFLSTKESGAHPKHKEALMCATCDSTCLTRAFTGRLARGLSNRYIEAMEPYVKDILPYPFQGRLTASLRKKAAELNEIDYMALWAGQNVHLCQDVSAKMLFRQWVNQLSYNRE